MRHFSLGMLGAALLLLLLPLALSSCFPVCGCLPPPGSNWTLPPATAEEAVAAVAKLAVASRTEQTSLRAVPADAGTGQPVFVVTGPTFDGVVDTQTGVVLEWLAVGSLPDSKDAAVSADQAQSTATSFLGTADRDTTDLTVATTLRPGSATSAYVVTWTTPGATEGMSVYINPSTGVAFAFVDPRFGIQPTPPTIGAAAAGKVAIAAVSTPGEVVTSTAFHFGLGNPTWEVTLAVPNATPSALPVHGASVSVDAVTGTATIGNQH